LEGKMDEIAPSQPLEEPVYEDLRPLLFSIAYRMIGSASEAEDIVQEAFLRFHRETNAGVDIESPKAWLTTVTTRLAINHIQSARVRRESYFGTWLPEPLITDTESEGFRHAETADSLSLAFLVLLESLGPVERAVFLLREVFEYGYDEIATIVGKTEDNCRQIGARARRQVEAKKPRFEASRRKRQELATRFFEAVLEGDADSLVNMLAADAVAYGDGGGKAPAFPKPVHGRDKVARLLLRAQRFPISTLQWVEVNGQPGAVLLDEEERVLLVVALDIADGLIQTVRAVANPDKLQHLQPAAESFDAE
ncbi:MAG TPA: RNA polymerase sigma-70 factor, partial [Vicinamibacterales bacterium]|nr:RNA polymerase sigma-70 factor [Vicinamibacterales bacterium]